MTQIHIEEIGRSITLPILYAYFRRVGEDGVWTSATVPNVFAGGLTLKVPGSCLDPREHIEMRLLFPGSREVRVKAVVKNRIIFGDRTLGSDFVAVEIHEEFDRVLKYLLRKLKSMTTGQNEVSLEKHQEALAAIMDDVAAEAERPFPPQDEKTDDGAPEKPAAVDQVSEKEAADPTATDTGENEQPEVKDE